MLWGIYHGLLLIINNLFSRVVKINLPQAISSIITFVSVLFGWTLFRAESLERVEQIWLGLIGQSGVDLSLRDWAPSSTFGEIPQIIVIFGGLKIFPVLIVAYLIIFCFKNNYLYKPKLNLLWGCLTGLLLFLSVTFLGEETPFLYFQF